MSKSPVLKRFVSEIDQFLQKFDSKYPELSKSQKKEQAKLRRIYALRDHANQAVNPHAKTLK